MEDKRRIDHIEEIEKFNPYHDERGRFASANSYAFFSTRTKDPAKQHMADAAVAREKERHAATQAAEQQQKLKEGSPFVDEGKVSLSSRYRPLGIQGLSNYNNTVLEATYEGDGEISLSRPTPTSSTRSGTTTKYEYELSTGVYSTRNRPGANASIGIDWDKVKVVSGSTFEARDLLGEKGFFYDSDKKLYTRQRPQAKVSAGKLTIPKGGKLPDDLSSITEIAGDTYANKDAIKAAGFKWNPNSKSWVKPGVAKSAVLLDDEPPVDIIIEMG